MQKNSATTLATAFLVSTLMACASVDRPLGPDEVEHTTMGYAYKSPADREKAERNRASLAKGAHLLEVVVRLGIPMGPLEISALSRNPAVDVHYGTDLFKFRDGVLISHSSAPEASNYQQTVIVRDPFNLCDAACAEFNIALRKGEADKFKTLLASNPALARSQPYDRNMPLHVAAARGDKDTVSLLLANGADRSARDRYGDMPIHEAAAYGDVAVARLLLADGGAVNVNAQSTGNNMEGTTPLHKAAARGHLPMAELLIAAGADVNAKTKNYAHYASRSPLSMAASSGRLDMVNLLLARGADVNGAGAVSPLAGAATRSGAKRPGGVPDPGQSHAIALLLLQKGADVNATVEGGQTPLHYAVMSGDDEFIRLLLANQANVNARNLRGETPLRIARLRKREPAVQLLEQAGARD